MNSKSVLCSAIAVLGMAALAALFTNGIFVANAEPAKSAGHFIESRPASPPLLAIVALSQQRVSIYDATGKILEAPVSSGTIGRETPAGIYSILQKEKVHHSNLYDDASMPFMERITWSGIALHAGVLPGYAASHGCVRMPHAFAEHLYQLTGLGMRVIVVREDIVPVDFAQPALFSVVSKDKADAGLGAGRSSPAGIAANDGSGNAPEAALREQLQWIAEAKTSEALTAIRKEKEARLVAAKKAAESLPAVRTLRAAEAKFAKAEAELKAGKTQDTAKFEEAQAQLQAIKLREQPKLEAAAQANTGAKAAAATMIRAIEAAKRAKQNTSPVSVFISRKTQRLYIRKGNQQVFESAVTIRDPGEPIGTFVYTALNYTGTPSGVHWNVVSMYKNAINIEPYMPVSRVSSKSVKQADAAPADAAGAQAALDRLDVPQEARDRIAEVILPGSSLIISDEGPSNEIGKDTEFIVFMSGEPQGGIAMRKRTASHRFRGFGGFFSLFGD